MRLAITTAWPEGVVQNQKQNKPDIVLIHGTGSGSTMWEPQGELLRQMGYRCFLVDLRGHGKTPEPKEVTNLAVHIEDLLESLEASGVRYPAVFVGHSLGAIISLTLAQTRPELFAQIFAVAMPGKIFPPIAFCFSLLLRAPYEKLRGTALQKALPWRARTLIDTDRFTLMQIVENFKTMDYISEPLQISCPVHFAAGRFDPVAMHFYVRKMHSMLPGSTFRIFEFAGHNFMDMYPKVFNAWLLKHLQSGL